ncbi:enoyl-CoA hydratase/isomerase family protein [Aestuariimicrobium sp. p3-SID1156]|uniref:enoyl-CoA hydratase/isomerase family protein n=1 Tax=Aestuariimicrobium sp. p3-SID1156 TaxID=2916038 RepID=UPI00223AB532|nr:enoyl-CoA hydratase/isomerase family protein [Aestuariimicrobium sp. p3-SID1156]MCT1458789.1 enoyl-CoA hydratase/isomerase family protein [Aestuariimicrobium sp. p3-SID1156]
MSQSATDPIVDQDVIVDVAGGVGRIVLNRPKAINALTVDMLTTIHRTLEAWRDDREVRSVEFSGAGERGFCSGADVRALRSVLLDEGLNAARHFFDVEYPCDALIATYPKPISSIMNGITMGGGMGLTLHTPRRIGTPTTQLAMPEVTIGLFPDVGATFELSRMPLETGTWMAMTGAPVDAASALWAGLLDDARDLEDTPEGSWLATASSWIAECFTGDDPSAILQRLENHENEDARACAELVRTKCPLSVAVALELVRRAALLPDVPAVLEVDRVLAENFMRDSDFAEGVRAQLVDKDRQPRWRHQSVEEVTRDEVLAAFEPAGPSAGR